MDGGGNGCCLYSYSPEFLCPYLLYLTLPSPPWVPLASVLETPGHFSSPSHFFFRSSRRNGGGLVPGGVVRCRWRFSAAVGRSSRRVDPARVIHTTPLAAITHTQHRSHHPLASCNRASCGSSQPGLRVRVSCCCNRLGAGSPSTRHLCRTFPTLLVIILPMYPHHYHTPASPGKMEGLCPYHRSLTTQPNKRLWNERNLLDVRRSTPSGGDAPRP